MAEKSDTAVEIKSEDPPAAPQRDMFATLRQEIDRLFDDFTWPGITRRGRDRPSMLGQMREWMPAFAGFPAIDLVEHDGEYELSAELPGLDAESIDVRVTDGSLTLRGEKSQERNEERSDYHVRERSFGTVQRSVALPSGIDTENIRAAFANGVLKVTLPKTQEARAKERKIEVRAA